MSDQHITTSRTRLREIIDILRKHDITKGLTPVKLRLILEDLGPTYIKFGQIMSMRTDMIPDEFCDELTKLRTQVIPMGTEEVRSVIEESLGRPLEDLFPVFDENALGSASIAQVHYAELKDGSHVAVKVKRIGIYDVMSKDIALLRRASGILKLAGGMGNVLDFSLILDELWRVAQEEMDFLIEARNTEEFYELNQDVAYSTCPRIYRNLSSSSVLVMEYIEGLEIGETENLVQEGYDLKEIGAKLANNYIKQIIDDGFFHADPHPGNIRIRDGKIVWIDLGMMGRLSRRDQLLLNKALTAIANNNVEDIKTVLLSMGEIKGKVNHAMLYSDIDDLLVHYGSMDIGDIELAKVVKDLLEVAKTHHISMPAGVSMLGRGIATMEGVLIIISPDINLLDIASNHLAGNMLTDIDWRKEIRGVLKDMIGSSLKAINIPTLVSDLLKMSIKGHASINLELHNSEDFKITLYKLISDLIIGLLIAALIVGSSLICTTDMEPKLLNIPALGAIGYMAASILIVWIIYDTWRKK